MTDLLSIASLILCSGIVMPLLFPRMPVWARATVRIATLVLLTACAVRIVGSPLRPVLLGEVTWDRLWQQAIVVGWWVVAARSVAGTARLLLSVQNRSRETQILSDLIGAGIYGATLLAIVDVVFAVPIGGLIATSGVVAVVIGLALQSTLADVFSGIAIDIERPYRAGDLLWVEGGIEGRVREVNWRSTLIVTGNDDVAIIPNSIMAKSRLVNHSLPTSIRRASLEMRLDPGVSPARCTAVLEAAVRACMIVLPSPPPAVSLTALRGDGAVYDITYSVATSAALKAAQVEVLTMVQRHLHFAAIPLATSGAGAAHPPSFPTAESLLAHSDLFGGLSAGERELLASKAVRTSFDTDAVIYDHDDVVDAIYLIGAGTVELSRAQADGANITRRLSPGDCFGVIGLVSNTPFLGTATALTRLEAFRLDRVGIQAAAKAEPTLTASLGDVVRRSKAVLHRDEILDAATARSDHSELFLSRLTTFLQMLGGTGVETGR